MATEKKSTRKGSFFIGLVVVLLAIVGAGTLISFAGSGVSNLLGDAKKKAEYAKFLEPVIANDPDPFDDVSKASQAQLLDCAIWKLLKQNADLETGRYEAVPLADGAGFQIPKEDVEETFTLLFGEPAAFMHDTIDGGSYIFTFDKTKQAYLVPITATMPIYIPRVTEIDKRSRTVVLTVGYLPSSEYAQHENGDIIPPEPDKYRKITLLTSRDGYVIRAIQMP